jgi:hypothetical protein
MWILFLICTWLIVSVPLAFLLGSFMGSHRRFKETVTSVPVSHTNGQNPVEPNPHPERPAA